MTADLTHEMPRTLPITVEQYRMLVEHGEFTERRGQVELIYGKIVEMNPQGPQCADPIDELGHWARQSTSRSARRSL